MWDNACPFVAGPPTIVMKKSSLLLAAATGLGLCACSTVLNNLPGVYTLDIEQGNIIDQSMVNQLRPNMTKRQVLYIMGSPMLTDAFHEKRWDYLYAEQPGGDNRMQKRISLFFEGDNLIGVQGDFRPSSLPVVKESTETSVDVPKRDLDRSMWEKITGLFGDEPDPMARRTVKDTKDGSRSAEKGKELVEEGGEQQ